MELLTTDALIVLTKCLSAKDVLSILVSCKVFSTLRIPWKKRVEKALYSDAPLSEHIMKKINLRMDTLHKVDRPG
jgi:hypothetical protein